jgi:hypothetical protein
MAEITHITLKLTMTEAKAVWAALGTMNLTSYGGDVEMQSAGSKVYGALVHITDTEDM